MNKALTIAGSDSGGGAGVEADLKAFAALRVYGTCAITSVTAQNTLGVHGAFDLPPEFVGRQLDTIHVTKNGLDTNCGDFERQLAEEETTTIFSFGQANDTLETIPYD